MNARNKWVKRVQKEIEIDEWDELLDRNTYWRTLRVTAWALRFIGNCRLKARRGQRTKGPLTTDEIVNARNKWVKRVQKKDGVELRSPGWKLVEEPISGILKCEGRITGYQPTYLGGGMFVNKIIAHVHNEIMHLGVSNTMAALRETWWIPKLREKVKRIIKRCNVCKLYSAKPFEAPATGKMPKFRTECGRPFEVTSVDFAGPLH